MSEHDDNIALCEKALSKKLTPEAREVYRFRRVDAGYARLVAGYPTSSGTTDSTDSTDSTVRHEPHVPSLQRIRIDDHLRGAVRDILACDEVPFDAIAYGVDKALDRELTEQAIREKKWDDESADAAMTEALRELGLTELADERESDRRAYETRVYRGWRWVWKPARLRADDREQRI